MFYSTSQNLLTNNQPVDYIAQGFMSFMRGVDITQAIGRVGLKVEPVMRHIIISLIGIFMQMRTEWMFQGPNTSRPWCGVGAVNLIVS